MMSAANDPQARMTDTPYDALKRLTQERDEARAQAEECRKWLNCGGVPTGFKCSEDGHDIYGGFVADADGNATCDVHEYQRVFKALAEAKAMLDAVTVCEACEGDGHNYNPLRMGKVCEVCKGRGVRVPPLEQAKPHEPPEDPEAPEVARTNRSTGMVWETDARAREQAAFRRGAEEMRLGIIKDMNTWSLCITKNFVRRCIEMLKAPQYTEGN